MKKYSTVFDYKDLFYNDEDPLLFLIRKSVFETIRTSYFMLSEKEKDLINNTVIFNNKINEDSKNKYDEAINALKALFRQIYLGGENDWSN